ncbi:FAD-dependent oxidoreductase [Exiguobacterium sp. AM39-5BH]|uniref:FAD-dependent oxidoreductase n=1 Tax=Exiguobacterium sp. AM39-5BH TaxID=2292355 RepID=UPI000FE1EFED|nr:FAD-dependent oxidoreductase [Exiguobacterium sp. AM39-5BH]RHB48531.1 FAD-dependent oxidoreductase [Exiguobacterium sp. AM39-5BH]
MTKSIAIIGAGASGLYAALLLIEKGYDVTVFESRARFDTTGRDNSTRVDGHLDQTDRR